MNIREILLWSKDLLTGGKLLLDLRQMQQAYDRGITQEQRQEALARICTHACTTVKAYEACDPGDLASFPVVNKVILKKSWEQHRSSAYPTMRGCRNMSTSGSTGTPFTVIQNSRKIRRNTAAVLFFGEMAGYRFGQRAVDLRVWSKGTRNRLKAKLMNQYQIDISSNEPEDMQRLFSYLVDNRIRHLHGYSSTFTALADALLAGGVEVYPGCVQSIIAASEALPLETEKKLVVLFGISPALRYSNMECGIMAERVGQNPYYIDSSSYYVEILHLDKDEPVPDGQIGRIVVTDLYNEAFPMIRYDTGDTGAIRRETTQNGGTKLYLTEVYGRRSDMIFDTAGRMLTPHVITNNLWTIPGLTQFKFIQTGQNTYTVRLNIEQDFSAQNQITERLSPVLGEDCRITLEYVDEIPVLASGKRQYIENIWKP